MADHFEHSEEGSAHWLILQVDRRHSQGRFHGSSFLPVQHGSGDNIVDEVVNHDLSMFVSLVDFSDDVELFPGEGFFEIVGVTVEDGVAAAVDGPERSHGQGILHR